MDDFHERALSEAGQAEMRAAVEGGELWYFHKTQLKLFETIRAAGLLPRDPDPGFQCPQVVLAAFESKRPDILCLTPGDSDQLSLGKPGPLMLLAVAARDLPARVGFDWSHPYAWNLARDIEGDYGSRVGPVFMEVGRRSSSIVVYSGIPPQHLRVCVDREVRDPAEWPLISQVEASSLPHIPGEQDVPSA